MKFRPILVIVGSLVFITMGVSALVAGGLWLTPSNPNANQVLGGAALPGRTTTLPSHTIIIHDTNQQRMIHTTAPTVRGALQEAGLTLSNQDTVEPPLNTPLTANLQIIIRRAIPLTISLDGQLIQVTSNQTNPHTVLAENGIVLAGEDFTRPGPETHLLPNTLIEIIRVTEDFQLQDTPIPYETILQPSDQIELDQQGLVQEGTPGILRQRIRTRYENGIAVSHTPDGEWIERQPAPQIMGYGTMIVTRILQTEQGAYEYWRLVRMRVTSYTAATSGKAPDHPAYGITASGVEAGTGIVAVDKAIVPFRSWVYVPGYGIGFAGDTGGGIIGRWIDLGYDEDALIWWSGYIDVYYLTPIPDPEDINYQLPTELP